MAKRRRSGTVSASTAPASSKSNGKRAAGPAVAATAGFDTEGNKQPLAASARPLKSALKGGRKRAEVQDPVVAEGGVEAVRGTDREEVVGKEAPKGKDAKGKEAKEGSVSKNEEPEEAKGKPVAEVKSKHNEVKSPASKRRKVGSGSPAPAQPPAIKKPKRKAKPTGSAPPKPALAEPRYTSFKLVFGTYERLLYGLHFTPSPSPSLAPLFSFPAHASALRCAVASPSGKTLLTSSTSASSLTLWNLRARREVGVLVPPSSSSPSVTCATFDAGGRVLCVGDEEGEVSVYRCRDWVAVRRLKGHRGRVNGVGVHGDGRVALSVGRDRCLRMWDLGGGEGTGKGKPVASARLGVEGDAVKWSVSGESFAVVTGGVMTLYDTTMKVLATVKPPRGRIHDVAFHRPSPPSTQEYVLIACEDGVVRGYEAPEAASGGEGMRCVLEVRGHGNRVKALSLITLSPPSSGGEEGLETTYVSTISSDGFARVFGLPPLPAPLSTSPPPSSSVPVVVEEPVAKFDTKGCRLTCLCVVGVTEDERVKLLGADEREGQVGGKRKRGEGDDAGSGDEDEEDEDGDGEEGAEGEGGDVLDGVDLDAHGRPLELGSDEGDDDVGFESLEELEGLDEEAGADE